MIASGRSTRAGEMSSHVRLRRHAARPERGDALPDRPTPEAGLRSARGPGAPEDLDHDALTTEDTTVPATGAETATEHGSPVWRAVISCPGANSLNVCRQSAPPPPPTDRQTADPQRVGRLPVAVGQ